MKVAALDLGTNSFLCLIARVERRDGQIKVTEIISDQVEIVRLGQDVQSTKRFHPDALIRARSCLEKFRDTIDQYKPEKILAMATSAARDVTNADELFAIGQQLNIPIEIIPGDREAEITFFGSISAMSPGESTIGVIDVGGGSTEIVLGSASEISFAKSANIGAVRITEMFFPQQPPTEKQFLDAQKYIQENLQFLKDPTNSIKPNKIVAVAGTPTELAKIIIGYFDKDQIDGFIIDQSTIEDWETKFKQATSEQRQQRYSVSQGRADVILAGVMILRECLNVLGLKEMIVSTRGVRYGVALEIGRRHL